MNPLLTTDRVLQEILAERVRQDDQWGQQNHPDGTGSYDHILAVDPVRRGVQRAAAEGRQNWTNVLAEEVAEAFAETDPARLRAELVQVAAVAVAWVEAIDRRTPRDLQQIARDASGFPSGDES